MFRNSSNVCPNPKRDAVIVISSSFLFLFFKKETTFEFSKCFFFLSPTTSETVTFSQECYHYYLKATLLALLIFHFPSTYKQNRVLSKLFTQNTLSLSRNRFSPHQQCLVAVVEDIPRYAITNHRRFRLNKRLPMQKDQAVAVARAVDIPFNILLRRIHRLRRLLRRPLLHL